MCAVVCRTHWVKAIGCEEPFRLATLVGEKHQQGLAHMGAANWSTKGGGKITSEAIKKQWRKTFGYTVPC